MAGLIVESMFPCECPVLQKVCLIILSDYIEGQKTGVWYEQFVVDGETYAYMENYDPSGRVIPLCQRVCRTCSAILW